MPDLILDIAKKSGDRPLKLLDIAITDLLWGLVIAAIVGAIAGLIYVAITSSPPEPPDAKKGEERKED